MSESIYYTPDDINSMDRELVRFYNLNYSDLVDKYIEYCNKTDEAFMQMLPSLAHFACIVMWIKGRGQHAISDNGIVHELIHLQTTPKTTPYELNKIREQFKTDLQLSR